MNFSEGNERLACPACGSVSVHPIALECRSPGTPKGHVTINNKGIFLYSEAPPIGRGVFIRLRFKCEEGDIFEYSLHFHKGNTFIKSAPITGESDNSEISTDETIWRD